MNNKKIIVICVAIFVIAFVGVCIAIVQASKHNLEKAKKIYKKLKKNMIGLKKKLLLS